LVVPKAGKAGKGAPKPPYHPERHLEMPVARDSNHPATGRAPRPSLAPLRNSVRAESFMALVLSLAGTERGRRC